MQMFERCLYFNANALVRELNRVWDAAYSETGLSAPHAYLLRLVCHGEGVYQQQAADELRLEKSTVTRFVSALMEKGLVERRAGEDGRENRLYPTASGKRLGKELDKIGENLYLDISKKLGKSEFASLVGKLKGGLKKLV